MKAISKFGGGGGAGEVEVIFFAGLTLLTKYSLDISQFCKYCVCFGESSNSNKTVTQLNAMTERSSL